MNLKHLYRLIKQRLKSNQKLDAEEIKWFFGQYRQTEENHWYVSKGIYIEFTRMPINHYGQGYQEAEVALRIHLAQACYLDNDDRVTDAAVAHLDQVQELNKTLHGAEAWLSELSDYSDIEGSNNDFLVFNQMELEEIEPDHNFRNMLVTVMRYRCRTYNRDNVEYVNREKVNITPKVKRSESS